MESGSLELVIDRQAIVNTLSGYVWGNDTRDLALLADCFSEDASCSGYVEEELVWGPMVGREKIVSELAVRIPEVGIRRHTIGSIRFIRLENGEAEVVSYMVVTRAEKGRVALETTGWYKDDLVKEDETWRIKNKEWHIDCAV
jgi:hypothetical protein